MRQRHNANTTLACIAAAVLIVSGCGGQGTENAASGNQVVGQGGYHVDNSGTGPGTGVGVGNRSGGGQDSGSGQNSSGGQNPGTPPAVDGVIRGWAANGDLRAKHLSNDAFQLIRIEPISPNGFRIIGKLRAFEAVGQALLKTTDGQVIPQGTSAIGVVAIHASEGAPAWGDFQADFVYPANAEGTVVTVEFYVNSAKDGSKTNVLEVKVEIPS